ncbi:hypothetical protein ScPMuIL_017997 [Solemya velum]
MAVSLIELNLEGTDRVYLCGSRIKGALVIEVTLPVIIAGVEVRFRGAARAKWRETVETGNQRTDVEHEKEEIYFDDRFCLWGRVNSQGRWDSREVLQRGQHMFPFQYKVPEGIPCSFEGPDAYVRYTVMALLVRYNGESITTHRTVNVLREFDPIKDQADTGANLITHPFEDYAERSVHNVCCRPGRISCSISLTKRAYVPGEFIRTELHVHNLSLRKSGAVSLQLKQLVSCGGVHTRTLLLQDCKVCESLRPGQHRQWREYPLRVPSTCPSKLHSCKVLDVRYCVAIEASFIDAVLYAAVPIIVSTIPESITGPIKWSYKSSEPPLMTDENVMDSYIYGCTMITEADDIRPKYKYYEELPDSRKERHIVLKLKHSPTAKRKKDKSKIEATRHIVKNISERNGRDSHA